MRKIEGVGVVGLVLLLGMQFYLRNSDAATNRAASAKASASAALERERLASTADTLAAVSDDPKTKIPENEAILAAEVDKLHSLLNGLTNGDFSLIPEVNRQIRVSKLGVEGYWAEFFATMPPDQRQKLDDYLAKKEQLKAAPVVTTEAKLLMDPEAAALLTEQETITVAKVYGAYFNEAGSSRDHADKLVPQLVELQMSRRRAIEMVNGGFPEDAALEAYRASTESVWRGITEAVGPDGAVTLKSYIATLPARNEVSLLVSSLASLPEPPDAGVIAELRDLWIQAGPARVYRLDSNTFGESVAQQMSDEKVRLLRTQVSTILSPRQLALFDAHLKALRPTSTPPGEVK